MCDKGVIILDHNGILIYADNTAKCLLNYSTKKLLSLSDFVGSAESKHILNELHSKSKYQGILKYHESTFEANGEKASLNGQSSYVITLSKKEKGLPILPISIIEETSLLIRVLDEEGNLLYLNEAGRKLLGYDKEYDITQTNLYDFHSKQIVSVYKHTIFPDIIKKGSLQNNTTYISKNNQTYKMLEVLTAHTTEGKKYFSSVARDITEEHANEEQRKIANQRLRMVEHVARIGYLELDIETDIMTGSNEALRILGIENEGFINFNTLLSLIHPNDIGKVHRLAKKSIKSESHFKVEFRYLSKNKGLKTIDANGRVIYNDKGLPVTILWIIQDITRRKNSEMALISNEKRLKTAEQLAKMGNYDWNIESDNMQLSDELYRILSLKKTEFDNSMNSFLNFIHPEDLAHVKLILHRYQSHKTQYTKTLKFRVKLKNGRIRYLYTRGETIFGPDNKAVRRVGIIQDVTSKVKIERMLKNAEKNKNELILQREKIGSEAIIFGQEEERQRISMEIHDGLGQILTAIGFHINYIESVSEPYKIKEINESIDKVFELMENAKTSIRTISNNLMPSILLQFGLFGALRRLTDEFFAKSNIAFYLALPSETFRFEQSQEISIYRIIQELLNNTVKHANPTTINLKLSINSKGIVIFLVNNGKGFNLKNASVRNSKGKGVSNIRQRVKFMSGEIHSKEKNGSITHISVPLS